MRTSLGTDVLVVGAGPAGAATALTAVARGLQVTVVDKARFPRDKTCGDGLTANALRLLERLDVPLPEVRGVQPVGETVLVDPDGRRVRLPHPRDGLHAAVVPRAELDAALVARVRDAGVDLREGVGLAALDPTTAVATLDDGTEVHARFVIGADGHYSPVRRMAGLADEPVRGEWAAFRQYFRAVDTDALWVLFERDLLPGYAWVFPLPDGRANVGFGMLREPGITGKVIAARWRELLERPAVRDALGPRAEPEGTARAWPIPASYSAERLGRRRVLLVGDAASVVDPMTGEGIAQALETGILAAEAMAGGGRPEDVRGRYRRSVDRALGRDLRFAAALQQILRSPAGTRWSIRAAGLTDWTRRSFARWMWEDYPRAILLTPDRWRRGVFTGPGAYLAS